MNIDAFVLLVTSTNNEFHLFCDIKGEGTHLLFIDINADMVDFSQVAYLESEELAEQYLKVVKIQRTSIGDKHFNAKIRKFSKNFDNESQLFKQDFIKIIEKHSAIIKKKITMEIKAFILKVTYTEKVNYQNLHLYERNGLFISPHAKMVSSQKIAYLESKQLAQKYLKGIKERRAKTGDENFEAEIISYIKNFDYTFNPPKPSKEEFIETIKKHSKIVKEKLKNWNKKKGLKAP